MADFLFEIGLEEVPARMIAGAQAELLKRTLALLEREQLVGAEPVAKSFSTPRRLAVLVENVREQQADITEEVTGPAVKIAYKDGVPTPAAEAFARKSGVAVSELKTIATPKGEYLAATSVKKGRSAAEVIASELPKELAGIYWAKTMYWRAGKPERFVRPVLWMVCLLGDAVVPVSFAGKTAERGSFGHRVLSSGEAFEVQSPQSYLAQLEGEYVLADVEVRRQKIRKALDKVTREVASARWREDEVLVDAVTHLTEWPDVLLGGFEADYLKLPDEVLVTVMRDHQKYFAVEDASGKLAPHFLTVTNIALDAENAAIIRQGNERVLRARFNDARFFWEFDQRVSLFDREEMLKSVVFQTEIGTYWEKSETVQRIVRSLSVACCNRGQLLDPFEQNQLEIAARLAKADLTTELVKEFTDLEGQIGGLYAREAKFSEIVVDCIYWQYEPRNAASPIPPSVPAQILGLADRMNTIVDMIALGKAPTGSKDPFALRRSANGVVKILAEGRTRLTLSDVYEAAKMESKFGAKTEATQDLLVHFFRERIEFYLREYRGQAYDVVKAVMAAGSDNLADLVARSVAVTEVRGGEDFLAVCAAFKRMRNIVTQADGSGITAVRVEMPAQVSTHPTQTALNNAVTQVSIKFNEFCDAHRYIEAVSLLATLRPEVDAFLDPKTGVKVMDDAPYVRETRLNLLRQILTNFSRIADFSEIVTAG